MPQHRLSIQDATKEFHEAKTQLIAAQARLLSAMHTLEDAYELATRELPEAPVLPVDSKPTKKRVTIKRKVKSSST